MEVLETLGMVLLLLIVKTTKLASLCAVLTGNRLTYNAPGLMSTQDITSWKITLQMKVYLISRYK
jgi:hypothetical protein